MNPFTMAWQAIISFSLADTVAQVKEALANLNFIRWYDLYNMTWEEIIAMASQNGDFAATTFGQYCAQYAATMTNWVYTLAAMCAIVILLCKKNKKWYWYMFFSIVAVMSVTSVGMHTADYGEFTPGVITTKLLASYVDMSFTELMAWSGVICFAFEFYGDDIAKRNKIAIGTSIWAGIVLLWLTFEVFVQKNRPLWIGGRDEFGMPYDMGGDKGGLSFAELGCFLTCIAFFYILFNKFKTIPKNELGIVLLIFATFVSAFVITSLWGDNEINPIALGNFHGHSFWHMLTAIGTFEAVVWVDTRTNNQLKQKELCK